MEKMQTSGILEIIQSFERRGFRIKDVALFSQMRISMCVMNERMLVSVSFLNRLEPCVELFRLADCRRQTAVIGRSDITLTNRSNQEYSHNGARG